MGQFKVLNSSTFERCSATLLAMMLWSCSDDLPQQQFGVTDPNAGVTAGVGGASGAGGAATGAGTAGKGSAATSGGVASGNAPEGSSDGNGDSSADGGISDPNASGGDVDGGASTPAPTGPVISACMGRAVGERVCNGRALFECGEQSRGTMLDMCMTTAQCNAGLEAGVCGICEPGEYRCTDILLEVCNMTGQWELAEMCATAALCSDVNQSCNPSECAPEAVNCTEDGTLVMCSPDQTGFEELEVCDAPELCDMANKRCYQCVPNSTMCDGDKLLTCSSEGEGPSDASCPSDAPKCKQDGDSMATCVQCLEDADCEPANDCSVAKCSDTGMCMQSLMPRESSCDGGMCDALGNCVSCLTNDDCDSTERCLGGILGCVSRAALEPASSFLPGIYYLTVNAGFKLTATTGGSVGSAVEIENTVVGNSYTRGARPEAETLTVTGPMGMVCSTPFAGDSVTFQFAEDMDGSCGTTTVTIRGDTE